LNRIVGSIETFIQYRESPSERALLEWSVAGRNFAKTFRGLLTALEIDPLPEVETVASRWVEERAQDAVSNNRHVDEFQRAKSILRESINQIRASQLDVQ
jgi:hypothetical protein